MIRLLVITQTVDEADSFLGFFCRWLIEFSKHFKTLTVICLKRGPAALPTNVTVHSLGKEHRQSRLRYLTNFYRLLWHERGKYDAVFVHMNLEYVLLAGLYWKMIGVPVFLWYNHREGGFLLTLASFLAHRVLYTSSFAFPRRFSNAMEMPAGIDVSAFTKTPVRKVQNSLLFLGRISSIKAPDVLLRAAWLLDQAGISFTLDIVGDTSPSDAGYYQKIRALGKPLEDKGRVAFLKGVANTATPDIYNSHEISVNLSPSGLFDKTVLEAMACESLVLVSSEAFRDILPAECRFKESDAEDLADKIKNLLHLSVERKAALGRELRGEAAANHSLSSLAQKLFSLYSTVV